jgi:hypothetical protein
MCNQIFVFLQINVKTCGQQCRPSNLGRSEQKFHITNFFEMHAPSSHLHKRFSLHPPYCEQLLTKKN